MKGANKGGSGEETSSSGQPDLPEGWRRELVARKGSGDGAASGKQSDVYIYDPSGKKFRSKPQLAKHFEENPDKQISQEDMDRILNAFKRNLGDEPKPPKSKSTKPEKPENDSAKSLKNTKKQIPMTPKQEMIVNAIKALDNKKGSDKKGIRNYIQENHKDAGNLKFVHKELKKCVEKGILVLNRRFFKIPGDESGSPKKRGSRGPYKKKDANKKTDDKTKAKEANASKTEENGSENGENASEDASENDENASGNEDNESENEADGEEIGIEKEENASENEQNASGNESEKDENASGNEEEGSENEETDLIMKRVRLKMKR